MSRFSTKMEIEIVSKDDERYKCGEVFMQIGEQSLIFVCTYCNESFKGLDNFVKHLYEELEKQNEDTSSRRSLQDSDENALLEVDADEMLEFELLCDDIDGISDLESEGCEVQMAMESSEEDENSIQPIQVLSKQQLKMPNKNTPKEPSPSLNEKNQETALPSENSTQALSKRRRKVTTKKLPKKLEPAKARENAQLKCEVCDKSYPSKYTLVQHSYTHLKIKPFPCDLCGARFANKPNLVVHRRRHTGEKPFVCDFCPSSFKSSTERTLHTRKHTGEKPYVCEECGRGHTSSGDLTQHRRRAHLNQRNYKCKECDRTFITNANLRRHADTVHKEVPRDKVCDVCDAAFTSLRALAAHKDIHRGKTHLCIICGKAFAQYAGLYSHMKTHNIVKENATME